MTKYVRETTQGKSIRVLRLDHTLGGGTLCVEATDRFTRAEQDDLSNGISEKGPELGHEIYKAIEYAEYVTKHATPDSLHKFNHNGYVFFVDDNNSVQE